MSMIKHNPIEFNQILLAQALEAGADDAQVLLEEKEYFEIQATHEGIQLVRTNLDDSVKLTVIKDKRKGEVSLNGREKADISWLVEEALQAAQGGVDDEANGVAEASEGTAGSHGSVFPDKEIMIESLLEYLIEEKRTFPKVRPFSSAVAFTISDRYFANSKGLEQKERRGYYSFSSEFGGKDEDKITSFNFTGLSTFQLPQNLMDAGITRRALGEAARSFDPRPVPGKFIGDVVITPECLSSLLFWLSFGLGGGALSGYGLLAKTTPYADMLGKQIASPCFTMRNEPRSRLLPNGADFDEYGLPTRDIDIIKQGVLQNFLIDHYISKKLGIPQTAGKIAITVAPGDQTVDELIANTEQGILLARYSGNYPNAQLDFSGVAKNSFFIENGAVQYPLVETMVSGNIKEMLTNIRALSRKTVNFGDGIYPYMAASGVTISSK